MTELSWGGAGELPYQPLHRQLQRSWPEMAQMCYNTTRRTTECIECIALYLLTEKLRINSLSNLTGESSLWAGATSDSSLNSGDLV